ncbi:hypothetical protein GIB67_024818 [Kingdonia uniflora]|uniref:Pentatricopeptide repeat-containing protein n=1 Tax=Kingdonia uniflora TaxID=39325 RepID=A0A7J7NYC3_9MAGN|nr:hypothetical protein GIB67_024818 [Kingdonia uniflora]
MIRGYAKSETSEQSVQLYNEMVPAEVKHDAFTYLFVLNACAKVWFLREGEQLHGRVLSMRLCENQFVETNLVNMYVMAGGDSGVIKVRKVFDTMTQRNVVTWNSMLAMYLRLGCVDEARETFDVMPERNGVSWTTMIDGCVHNGKSRQALALYHQMWRACVEVDEVTMVATLSACTELGDLETGRWIHSYVDKTFGSTNQLKLVSLNNAIIHMYARVIEEAYRVFKKMKRRSIASWTTVITGLAKLGRGSEALDVFPSMLSVDEGERVLPDEVTFLRVFCACNHIGMVNEGHHYFKYMTQAYGIESRIEHYGCFVDLLSRVGLLDETYELIGTMSLKPNEAVWGALLGGCRIHRNIKLASYVGDNLISKLKPIEAAMGYFTLLSNAYASANRWVDVANVRQKMAEMGVKKPPGHSQIQVNGVIH